MILTVINQNHPALVLKRLLNLSKIYRMLLSQLGKHCSGHHEVSHVCSVYTRQAALTFGFL